MPNWSWSQGVPAGLGRARARASSWTGLLSALLAQQGSHIRYLHSVPGRPHRVTYWPSLPIWGKPGQVSHPFKVLSECTGWVGTSPPPSGKYNHFGFAPRWRSCCTTLQGVGISRWNVASASNLKPRWAAPTPPVTISSWTWPPQSLNSYAVAATKPSQY